MIVTEAPGRKPRTSVRGSRVLGAVLAFAIAVHVLVVLAPWRFAIPAPGLGSSWIQVLAHAGASGWQWGSQIVFTYGPLGYLRTPIFHDALVAPVLFWNGLLAFAVIAGLLSLLRDATLRGQLVLYAVVALAMATRSGKAEYLLLPLMANLLHFRAPARGLQWPVVVTTVATAVYGLAYTSLLVSGLWASLLIDASRAVRARWPVVTPMFLLAVVATYLLAGQDIALLPRFLRSVAELIAGYGDAMAVTGNARELWAFLALSVLAMVLVGVIELRITTPHASTADRILLLAALAGFWFVGWKTGFVRHDLHSATAWSASAMGLAAYAAMRWRHASSPLTASIVVIALLSSLLTTVSGGKAPSTDLALGQARAAFVDLPVRGFVELRQALTEPAGWRTSLRQTRDAALARLRALRPELKAEDTVDVIGFDQGALLAHGSDYRPAPVFQHLAAYTPWLIDVNRSHLRSDRAAQTLFASSATIDNRYPLSELGNGFIELLARYRPVEMVGEFVRLAARPEPAEPRISEVGAAQATMGTWVPVPAHRSLLRVSADARPDVLGRAMRLVWRAPALYMTVRLADGREVLHRIVPAVAADGLLLSPYPASASVLVEAMVGSLPDDDRRRVVAIKVDTASPSGRRFFDSDVSFRWAEVHVSPDPTARESPAMARYLERHAMAVLLARSAPAGSPVEARGALLFAHAPATLQASLSGVRGIDLKYGLLEDAWRGDQRTDGVCFRVRALDDAGRSTQLHERCLDPLEVASDRGEQRVRLQAPGASRWTLMLETECRAHCSWDWSYWKDIDVLR